MIYLVNNEPLYSSDLKCDVNNVGYVVVVALCQWNGYRNEKTS